MLYTTGGGGGGKILQIFIFLICHAHHKKRTCSKLCRYLKSGDMWSHKIPVFF